MEFFLSAKLQMGIAGALGGMLHAFVERLRNSRDQTVTEAVIAVVAGAILGAYIGPACVSAFDLHEDLGLASALFAGVIGLPLVVFAQQYAAEVAKAKMPKREQND